MVQLLDSESLLMKNRHPVTFFTALLACGLISSAFFLESSPTAFDRDPNKVHAEVHLLPTKYGTNQRSDLTLRDFLLDTSGFYLGLAPSFFGFYGYFGALAAWEDGLSNSTFDVLQGNINGVAGASAGAMAAILLAAGIPPRRAAEFCTTISLTDFADFPGLFTIFRGDKFEKIMYDFMKAERPKSSLLLQDADIPVAVSGFDIQRMEGRLLQRGSMARAARASACFPFLFQPVGWVDGEENYLFVDGGIADTSGVAGLAALHTPTRTGATTQRRVVNLVVGDFLGTVTPGPSDLPDGVNATQLLSITIQNLPPCGPLNMPNGPLAVEAARRAMRASLDALLFLGKEEGHYELHIDASHFVPVM